MAITIRYKTFTKSRMIKMALQKISKSFGGMKGTLAATLSAAAMMSAFSGAVQAEKADFQPVYHNQYEEPALVQAGDYGLADTKNIAIMVYYGPGNGVTAEQVGEFITNLIKKEADLRQMDVVPAYFVEYGGAPGIAVAYHVGGASIDKQGIRNAVKPDTINAVLDKRQLTAKLFAFDDTPKPEAF